jgi:hypothetical protein
LNQSGGFQLLERLSDVASSGFGGVIWFDGEAFSSSVFCAQPFQSYWLVCVDLSQDCCISDVPPVRVLGLFLDVRACLRYGCPRWRLNLVNVFFQVLSQFLYECLWRNVMGSIQF